MWSMYDQHSAGTHLYWFPFFHFFCHANPGWKFEEENKEKNVMSNCTMYVRDLGSKMSMYVGPDIKCSGFSFIMVHVSIFVAGSIAEWSRNGNSHWGTSYAHMVEVAWLAASALCDGACMTYTCMWLHAVCAIAGRDPCRSSAVIVFTA